MKKFISLILAAAMALSVFAVSALAGEAEKPSFKVAIVRPLDVIRHNYTTYRITLRCFQLRLEGEPKGCPVPEELTEATACQWIAPQDIEAFPLPAPHRKLADNCSLFDNPASGE